MTLPLAPFSSNVLNEKIRMAEVIKYSTARESISERAVTTFIKVDENCAKRIRDFY